MIYTEKFIGEHFSRYRLMKYLENRLERAGLANVDIQRTPVMTRITLQALNPARIIGKRGRLIGDLTDEIRQVFGIENPQISVMEVREPFLEPRIVARKAARQIEMGKKVRAVLHFCLREILARGAMGAEIVAAGKIGAKGARAKRLHVSAGYIPKAGDPVQLVRKAHLNANTRSGVIGILVRIVPPGTVFPDKPAPVKEEKAAGKEEKKEAVEEKTTAKPKEESKKEEMPKEKEATEKEEKNPVKKAKDTENAGEKEPEKKEEAVSAEKEAPLEKEE